MRPAHGAPEMFAASLSFAAPAVLLTLILLAALFYFLRVTPPRPRAWVFPPLALLFGLKPVDPTPARTPWPILLLRMAIAAAIIGAMAGPLWNALRGSVGQGALVLLIDDGWAAAPNWERRIAFARDKIIANANRAVAIKPMSSGGLDIIAADARQAQEKLRALRPQPYAPTHQGVLEALQRFWGSNRDAEIIWVADGLDLAGASAFAKDLAQAAGAPAIAIVADAATPRAIVSAQSETQGLSATLARADVSGAPTGRLKALDSRGRMIAEKDFDFAASNEAKVLFELPVEIANDVTSLAIAGENTAGAVNLLDGRWRRRRVALYAGGSAETAQPLLAPQYYLSRALSPFAELREAKAAANEPIQNLLDENPSVFILADAVVAPGEAHDRLAQFVADGGVLVRFAGTRLAATGDDLAPVALRRGGRTLGGALSWDQPKHLAPFDKDSPFFGLNIPDEVTVSRQVLAEPDPGLDAKTWARLADGTPLVSAARRGKGLLVLFHVTADTTWSDLPISGLFIDMLRRLLAQAGASTPQDGVSGAAPKNAPSLPPYRTLDGFGVLGPPPASATPAPIDFAGPGDSAHPPGFYGDAQNAVAINALKPGQILTPASYAGLRIVSEGLNLQPPLDLRPWLLGFALLGFLADGLIALLRGGLGWRRPGAAMATMLAVALLFGLAAPGDSRAQSAQIPSSADQAAALQTRLAYVITGDVAADETSRAGLATLAKVLARRTSAQPGDPVGLDPAHDDLSFYPLIYWPIVASQPMPPPATAARIAAYMQNGGTMLFDTRDALNATQGGPPTPEAKWLQTLLAGVDVPEMEPVPRDHVVTKSFYLLDGFVGRTDMGQTWIEALPARDANDRVTRPVRAGDSVSPIIIASNDLAAAWALDDEGRPLYPLTPGTARQREMALRGGVNLVMYALTGNYKADQVHAKDLLERLSR